MCLKPIEFFLNGKEGWKWAFDQDGREQVGGPGSTAHGGCREARAEAMLSLILGSAGLKCWLTEGQSVRETRCGFISLPLPENFFGPKETTTDTPPPPHQGLQCCEMGLGVFAQHL